MSFFSIYPRRTDGVLLADVGTYNTVYLLPGSHPLLGRGRVAEARQSDVVCPPHNSYGEEHVKTAFA